MSVNGTYTDLEEVLTNFQDFLSATQDDRPIVKIAVPIWGRSVLMRAMTSMDRDEWEFRYIKDELLDDLKTEEEKEAYKAQKITYGDRLIGMKARLVAKCVVNPAGDRIFSEADVAFLEDRNAAAIDMLYAEAQKLNGFTQADMQALNEAREAAKNDNASPVAASDSD